MSLNRLTLVLNASYEPINVIGARRALLLVLGGKAHVEEPSGHFIRTSKMSIQIHSVVRLLVYRRMSRQSSVPSRSRAASCKSIMMRDRYTCQYCHRQCDARKEPHCPAAK